MKKQMCLLLILTLTLGGLTATYAEDKPADTLKAADVNADGIINILDLTLVASHFGKAINAEHIPNPDVNADGIVSILDLVIVAAHTGKTVPSVTPPEPPAALEGMVLIPAGEFQMGSKDWESGTDEQPIHTVYVDAFYIDTHEVTNLDFQRFVLANPQWQKSRIPNNLHNGSYLKHWDSSNNYPAGKANHPVRSVSWYAAVAYAKWAGKRLPTEAEWEKAARGGKSGLKYPWGNTISSTQANYDSNVGGTTAVGAYPANGYGLYDMVGNVWEWCLDAYNKDYYFSSPARNPLSDVNTLSNVDMILDNYTQAKSRRVLRGGSWAYSAQFVRVAFRGFNTPLGTYEGDGFRCARSVSP